MHNLEAVCMYKKTDAVAALETQTGSQRSLFPFLPSVFV